MTRKAFLIALALLCWAAAPASAAEPIQLTVSVIHATNTDGGVDPALKPIEADLKGAFGQYRTFKRVGRVEHALSVGGVAQVKLPSQPSPAELQYKGLDPKDASLHQIALSVPSKKVKVDLRLPTRKVFYQAGLKHDGGILILAIYLKPGA